MSTRNVLQARTDWEAVCSLAAGLCNPSSAEEDARLSSRTGLVWVARRSVGGREVRGAAPVDYVDDRPFGGWDGYAQEGARFFRWTSASSGAVLTAVREDGEETWFLRFEGREALWVGPWGDALPMAKESQYLASFAVAACHGSVTVKTVPSVKAGCLAVEAIGEMFAGAAREVRERLCETIARLADEESAEEEAALLAAEDAEAARLEVYAAPFEPR